MLEIPTNKHCVSAGEERQLLHAPIQIGAFYILHLIELTAAGAASPAGHTARRWP